MRGIWPFIADLGILLPEGCRQGVFRGVGGLVLLVRILTVAGGFCESVRDEAGKTVCRGQ